MEEEIILESLKAVNDIDISVYKKALDIALKDKRNTNIALSGSYGSGKSSIIESYKKNDDVKYRFLHISLAQYISEVDDEHEDELEKNSDNILERNLEGKILNQLLHQIKASKIPQTIFKVKRKTKFLNLLFWSLSIPTTLLLLTYAIGFNKWSDFISANFHNNQLSFLKNTATPELRLISLLIIFILLSVFVFKFTKLQMDKGLIQKISVKGNEIEVLKESKESYFDKYLNDVIYLFENADADVIVFEDIDRYSNRKIFDKLKEINTLVNQRNRRTWTQARVIKYISSTNLFSKIKKWKIYQALEQKFPTKRQVIFLYLLRDDIFISKDRTKFFDVIIPVIPVIDASNSYEKFIEIFKNGNLLHLFDNNFLQKLSLYVDDMRLLKNIYNEFVIYHKEINKINLNPNKLLAIITYKNIFPRDFSELQLSKGFIYSLFTIKKEEIIKKKVSDWENNLEQIEEDIELINKEVLSDINELIALFLPNDERYRVDGKEENEFTNRLEFVKQLRKSESRIEHYRIKYGSYSWSLIDFKQISQIMEQNSNYLKRKKYISNKSSNTRDRLIKEQNVLQRNLDMAESIKLSQVISNEDIETLSVKSVLNENENFDQIKKNDYFLLLSFLIRNDYLDESYADYMTYFYPNSLTVNDRLFLRSITDEKALSYTYELSNIKQILSRMNSYDFSKKEAWNFDLLNYMLDEYKQYNKNIERMIISMSEKDNLDFINSIFIGNRENNTLVRNERLLKVVFSKWDNFVTNQFTTNTEVNNSILKTALTTLNHNELDKQNSKNELTDYLNYSQDFLENLPKYSEKLINNFHHLHAKFIEVNFSLVQKNIAKAILTDDLYVINFENLKNIFEHFYNIQDEELIIHKNYTLMNDISSTKLLSYINQNINSYMKEYLDFSKDHILDTETFACELINNSDLDKNLITKYIYNLKTILTDITAVSNKEFWKALIENSKVDYSENNLLQYYMHNQNQWTDELVMFVNNSEKEISIDLGDVIKQQGKINLFGNTIKQYKLNNSKYTSLVSTMKLSYSGELLGSQNFSLEGVPNDKLSILIDNQIIEMTAGTLADVRVKYPNKTTEFIIKNLTDYLELISDSELYDEDEILHVLEKENKIKIAESITNDISISGKEYSDELLEFILKNKFDLADLSDVVKYYLNYSNSIQKTILALAIEHLNLLVKNEIDIKDSTLLKNILDSQGADINFRRELFSNNLSALSKKEIKSYLSALNFPSEFLGLFHRKRPKIEITDLNYRILNYLKTEGWIHSFKEEENCYRVIGKEDKTE